MSIISQNSVKELCNVFQEFCINNNLPFMSADELLCEETIFLNQSQKEWLKDFINIWDIVTEQEYK